MQNRSYRVSEFMGLLPLCGLTLATQIDTQHFHVLFRLCYGGVEIYRYLLRQIHEAPKPQQSSAQIHVFKIDARKDI